MTTSVWDFLIVFFILFAVLAIIVVTLVFRAKPKNNQEVEDFMDINQEKVIVKEIVKIRCRYCGFTYDQGLDSCPNCGART
jgi:rubrerythrin